MATENILREMVIKRQNGIHTGIPSFCCANKIVIEAILEQAQRFGDISLIEATSNQVNQNGGYMGMTPKDFSEYVYKIADKLSISRDKICLGGDHMGPLPWKDLPASEAMEHAKELVSLCVKAGYKKIHLDTSMRLGDDPKTQRLPDEVIAERGAILYKACEESYQEMLQNNPEEMHPVFVIGSEVPIPGGEVDEEKPECIQVTKVRDFENTLMAYKKKFKEHGLQGAWEHIVAIVVQPGVEFGDETLHHYNRDSAQTLCRALKKYPELVFEGHSTDFQAPVALRQMVEDGIAIIKVGPALTFALREAIFALSMIEDELISDKSQRSNFRRVLEDEMRKEPKYWQSYYAGQENEIKLKLKYSFSDRSRYYMSTSAVETARRQLFENINSNPFPISMLKQYMPLQYVKVRDGLLTLNARELVKDSVKIMIDDYNYAVKQNYTSSQHSVFFV